MSDDASIQFVKQVPGLGVFTLRSLRTPEDIPMIHDWVTRGYAKYWGMLNYTLSQVEKSYRELVKKSQVYIGRCNGRPVFLMEVYAPEAHPVGEHYTVEPGDRGMHVLVAPAEIPVRNFSWVVFTTVMDFLFSDPAARRVVVEPDIRNEKIHKLNRRAGFEYQKTIRLANKTAYLAFCTRRQYFAALAKENKTAAPALEPAEQAVRHLQPESWAEVNRQLVKKMMAEFAHERIIVPELQTSGTAGHYELSTDQPSIRYSFRARILALEHWHIDVQSIVKTIDGDAAPLDALSFIIEFRETLGMNADMLPVYLEEIASTLYAGAYKSSRTGVDSDALTRADFQTVEMAMSEGHPVFVANSGRIGFDAVDYHAYAPEAGRPFSLVWLAVRAHRSVFACLEHSSYAAHMEQELGAALLERFANGVRRHGRDPDDYYYLPVHPWQWFNKIATIFSPDIAAGNILYLGYGDDRYQPQQSIRTLFNVSHPQKCYVKTALSILNMGFMRGLSPYYMSTTPAINDWIHTLVEQDPYLAARGFGILREIAAVGYRNHYFESAIVKDSPYKKMLSALWRESPLPRLKSGQRLMTMASLLHVDAQGVALLPKLIASSGMETAAWIRHYLQCYLAPLLHCFYAHDLVFMPHGENLILILENNLPIGALMKDIAEESAVLNTEIVLSEKIRRLSVNVPSELKILSLFTDIFDCIFRFVSHILHVHAQFPEQEFWRLVADCVLEYQHEHPELSDKFRQHDLFAAEFTRSCLNRLQLSNNQQMIDLADPAKNLKFYGKLANPIACYAEKSLASEKFANLG